MRSSLQRSELYMAVCGPACLPLLGLLAASLRLSPHELAGEGARHQLYREIACGSMGSAIYVVAPADPRSGYLPRFLLALLRGDTLHAAGRQLVLLAGSPEAAAATATAEQTGSSSPLAYAADLLYLVYTLIQAACVACQAPQTLQLREALVAALEGSQVLEHAGRALLLLRLHRKDAQLNSRLLDKVAFAANAAHTRVAGMVSACGSANGRAGRALADRLRAVVAGRCSRHAALCLGLAVLCDADGGPAYGMPPELLAALPAGKEDHAPDSRIMSAKAATQLRGMVRWLHRLGAALPGPRTTLALQFRVGWLAVASARALTAADRGGGGSGGTGGLAAGAPRRILAAGDLMVMTLDALQYSWPCLPPPTGVPERDSVRTAEAAGWWRLAAAVAADVLPYAPDGQAAMLGNLLDLPKGRLPVRRGLLSLPPEPPFEVAAALEGGLLRCLERLMRRAGRDPQGPEAAVLRTLGRLDILWPYLAPLLAYGEPRQAAALVATLRKLLRTVGPRAMLAEWAKWAIADGSHEGLLQAVFDVLYEAPLLDVSGAAPGEGPSPASQQLLRLVSCAACEWLPELAWAVVSEEACCAVAAVYTGPGPPAAVAGADRPGHSAPDDAAPATVGSGVREAEGAATGLAPAAGTGRADSTAAAGGTPDRPPLPWRPELLREAATQLRSYEEHEAAAEAEALAAYLERGGDGAYQATLRPSPLASAMPPPAEARRLLPGRCANPACANLEGDSEAGLTLKACAGCGAVGYCCRPCQLEHWRAGHKGACGRARGGGGA
ncbi:hypothetical protein GPECTOR_52g2 [Gonium pectorale]|uniref:phytol kinase n=1 Tax=Gonium pectorale TaxID=33097 RepID=A0A150G6Z7_GONPE|nr:hypothetical protein GPECTOR_52g2 [Gonium pectorale]|eukprot:KXZ45617.1 hypothetical protein GPECTOR_52g2 [Gonium pectorale]